MSALSPDQAPGNPALGAVPVLEFRAALSAPAARVFAALTESGLLTRWFCDRAESEPRAGGRIVLTWSRAGQGAESFVGEWSAFEPFRACAYAGGHAGYPDGNAGLVEFSLEPRGSLTALTVRHTFPSRPGYETIAPKYGSAWPRALARLEALLSIPSTPEPRP
jgi:uncharacterized protein YndB with AHSA1/START domain